MAVAPGGRRGMRIDRVGRVVLCAMFPFLQSSGDEDWHGPCSADNEARPRTVRFSDAVEREFVY